MVGLPYDFLTNPLGVVRSSFDRALSSGSDPSAFDGKDWGAVDLFREFLFDDGGLYHVPILNPATIPTVQPNTLVRFRGMIQDMLGNEFYVGADKDGLIWRTNKFADVSQFPMGSSPNMRVWERRLLYCIPVPGQNSWTESSSELVMNTCTNFTSPPREKRQRDDDTTINDIDMMVVDNDFQDSSCLKRMREDGQSSESSWPKVSRAENTCLSKSLEPISFENSFPCLVKIYDSPEPELKLNDVFEFVCVLTFDTELTEDKDDSDELANCFHEELVHFPPGKVPRLHCLIHRKLASHDLLYGASTLELKSHVVRDMRESLLGHLTALLGNDSMAAHFMLLHLLSKVHARVDTLVVGKLSFNLTGFSEESISVFGRRLDLAVKELLPFTRYIPLTVDFLNSVSLAPRKDYQTNRLVSGVLQLAEGSHLTIDETKLQAGTLNSIGVDNARLLKNLMESQKVEYDFTYYKMEMVTDVQLLILSEGKSNILPADIVLPIRPSSVGSHETVNAETLQGWRWYLATLRSLPHSIDPEMQKVLEDDLVAARQANRSVGNQDFNRWLTMARLMSVSFGETSLSLKHWQAVKELERLRNERLQGNMLK